MSRILALCLTMVFALWLTNVSLSGAEEKPAADGNFARKTDDVKSWRFEQHEMAKGTISVADGAIVFDVTKEDGTDWHVQAFQTPLDFKDGQEYVVTFKAKSDADRSVRAQAGIDQDDWHQIGFDEEVALGKEWKDYRFTFAAANVVAMKNRIGFVLGTATGKVSVKDLVVKPLTEGKKP